MCLNQQTSGACTQRGGGRGQVAELLGLSADEKLELGQAVLRAVLQKEEALRVALGREGDYTKSFSGTKQDTQVSNSGWMGHKKYLVKGFDTA